MDEPFEKKYQDVLQNIESSLISVYRKEPKLMDHGALYVVESLIKIYNAESQGRSAAPPQFQTHEQEAYDDLRATSEWRLGRQKLTDENDREIDIGPDPITLEEMIACLKRIKKSIEFWQKRGGRRAYYDFVSEYV